MKFDDNTKILKNYNTFIFDIWGVLHDGKTLYPHVNKTFEILRSLNKKIILLSNAPRPNHVAFKKLTDMGLDIKLDEIVTSGDFFLSELRSKSNKIFDDFAGSAFIIGENVNKDLFEGVDFNRAKSINEADFLVLLMFADQTQELEIYDNELKVASNLNIPALCPNPDKIVIEGAKVRYPAGAFAARFEKMGGKVYYFGKPHKNIYEFIFDKFKPDLSKTLMIGDSFETDIKGAENARIDSLLLLTGVHANESDVASLSKKYNTLPTYVAQNLGEIINGEELTQF